MPPQVLNTGASALTRPPSGAAQTDAPTQAMPTELQPPPTGLQQPTTTPIRPAPIPSPSGAPLQDSSLAAPTQAPGPHVTQPLGTTLPPTPTPDPFYPTPTGGTPTPTPPPQPLTPPTPNIDTVAPTAGGSTPQVASENANQVPAAGGSNTSATASAAPLPPGSPTVLPTTASGLPGANLSTIDPNNNLINQTILPSSTVDPSARTQALLDSYLAYNQPFWNREDTQFGERAAALGRTGLGDTTYDLGQMQNQRALGYQQLAAQLAQENVGTDISQEHYNEQELQNERAYQNSQAQQALANRLNEIQMESGLGAQNQNQAQSLLQSGTYDPTYGELGSANYFGNQSATAMSALAQQQQWQAYLAALQRQGVNTSGYPTSPPAGFQVPSTSELPNTPYIDSTTLPQLPTTIPNNIDWSQYLPQAVNG